jgi:hypothetical protein
VTLSVLPGFMIANDPGHIAPPIFAIMEWATLMARLGSEEAQKFCRGR